MAFLERKLKKVTIPADSDYTFYAPAGAVWDVTAVYTGGDGTYSGWVALERTAALGGGYSHSALLRRGQFIGAGGLDFSHWTRMNYFINDSYGLRIRNEKGVSMDNFTSYIDLGSPTDIGLCKSRTFPVPGNTIYSITVPTGEAWTITSAGTRGDGTYSGYASLKGAVGHGFIMVSRLHELGSGNLLYGTHSRLSVVADDTVTIEWYNQADIEQFVHLCAVRST